MRLKHCSITAPEKSWCRSRLRRARASLWTCFTVAKHHPQTGAVEVAAEHCAQMETMRVYAAQCSGESECLASGSVVALGVVAAIVQCRQVPASRLRAAIHKLEHSAELGVDTSCCGCALLQFFLGKGKASYMTAAFVLAERQQEL